MLRRPVQLCPLEMLEPQALNALLAAIAKGDRAALACLFGEFAPRIVSVLIRDGMTTGRAEEIAQDAMLSVWRKSASFDASRGTASSWIYAIARNASVDRFRREGPVPVSLDDDVFDVEDQATPIEDQLSDVQQASRVRHALRQLQPDQINVLNMAFFSDRSHSEIAHDLCLPLGTVKSQIRRALLHLKRILGPAGP